MEYMKVKDIETAYKVLRSFGYTPINMDWYVKQGLSVCGIPSVETYGPNFFNHPKMYVEIEQG